MNYSFYSMYNMGARLVIIVKQQNAEKKPVMDMNNCLLWFSNGNSSNII